MLRIKEIVFGIITAGVVFTGCKDDDDVSSAKAVMKFTVTVQGADSKDQVDFGVGAGNHDASQYGSPIWKINGTTQNNDDDVFLDIDHFTGTTKTYVLETVKPFNFCHFNVTVSNFDGAPISVSYKAEVNGNVETNVENTMVAADQTYGKTYTYTAK
ncbi:hypothetical protein ACKW6Q_14485 [Chryseobacterium kwangjuense]|uniref:Lipoprotein n=1 Tax=Chryseobacterium kwangjuense TaxID=267125 RepID=A0ABW9K4B8_9FLAO